MAVAVITSDADATYAVSGNSSLVPGLNVVTVAVTAADGTVVSYERSINVPGLSSDKSLLSLTVDGVAVAVGGSVSRPYGTTSVAVVADPTSDYANYSVTGASSLVSGANIYCECCSFF
ncbi:MAG: hypothetical protein EBY29_13300 [Planctomycetes bacterium]|nr:hypothetical protein [Planctomycetota bacterium]